MILSDHTYRRLRRFHALTGLVPVGAFLIAHYAINLTAFSGPEAFDHTVEKLSRLPGMRWIEILVIGLPIAAHVVLGAMLGNTQQALVGPHGYPRDWMLPLQRGTGIYLTVYLVFHVWSVRLAPHHLAGRSDRFGLMSQQLHNPVIFSFYALAVLAACAHLSLGLVGFARHWGLAARPRAERTLARAGGAAFLLLSAAGISAMAAFVSHAP